MFSNIHIIRKLNAQNSERVRTLATAIEEVANDYQLFVFDDERRCNERTLVIALGGDGTMLEAMRVAAKHNSVAMGINLGKVGFLTDFSADDVTIRAMIRDVFEYQTDYYPIEHRVMVSAHIASYYTIVAGNEITVAGAGSDEMISYRLTLNDVDAGVHRANSIIVATPTGSTAYSLSAGGALMMPNMKALQLVPVAPVTMTSRPLIVGQDTKVTISAWGNMISVRGDGQKRYTSSAPYSEENPFVVTVECLESTVRIMHEKDWSFFDVLSAKLGWIRG